MNFARILIAAAFLPVLGSSLLAQSNDASDEASKPVAVWRFDKDTEAGPRPPVYAGFPATNTAHLFAGTGTGIPVKESEFPVEKLRFGAGESITLEAWVRVKDLKDGSYAYLVGKGRNRKAGFPEQNQNFALRLKGEKNEARVSFLFASAAAKGKPSDWHRWTSATGFAPESGWHHVAVTYTFGNSKSLRGYIDGQSVTGTWDMGGATDRAPVEDADDLTLGAGNGGGAGNNLNGWLDDVMIWRTALPAGTLTGRYQFTPPPPVVVRANLPRGKVRVDLCESGMPTRNAWPDQPLVATEQYEEDAFGFFEIPQKYTDTGVRADRPNPLLFRAAANVSLPPGKHRVLLRSRGASRLYLDEKLILANPFPSGDGSGHGHVRNAESYLNLGPDFRFSPPGTQEQWATVEVRGEEQFVVLETIVGGILGHSRRRPELGETVIAVSLQGTDSWELLTPSSRKLPYTDAGWTRYATERAAVLDRTNTAARTALREKHADFWNQRRQAANEWLAAAPPVPVLPLPQGFPANNPIDHFLAAKIVRVKADTVEAGKPGVVDYFRDVKPILEARCYDCHAGAKAKGGLRLDERAASLIGGKSDGPAVVPRKPGESALLARVRSKDADEVMPPKGEHLSAEQIQLLETWVKSGAKWPELDAAHTTLTPLTDDLTFLRRVTLDTVGVVPSEAEARDFLADQSQNKREKLIDRLLADPRWADQWMGYWQDVLAENPNILNPTLNNTGPFRWWIYESLRDNKPADLFVTELLRMKGSVRFGGPAGFAVASQNDSPFAAKGVIVAAGFLGIEMKCARCHDAPAHSSTQRDLFELAALLGKTSLKVPVTSSVPLDKIHQGGRKPLISVTLKPGTTIEPKWPFPQFAAEDLGAKLAETPDDPRDRLAALVTAPQNERFSQVMANRIWKRFMGRGIVEPVDDWEKGKPTHPELLKWLGREFVRGGYDVKQFARLILTSHAYQRATDRSLKETPVLFTAPAPRRLSAEQVVDSLFAATGKPFRVEEVSLDVDGQRDLNNSISLGQPRRAWMLMSTSNERDRPSLALPRIQAVADVLQAFGWRGSRQEATSVRELSPNVLQPAILSNGTMGIWLTRLSDDHGITELALRDQPLDKFLDSLFLRMLTRLPTVEERAAYTAHLQSGFAKRVLPVKAKPATARKPVPYVSWSNHLDPNATTVRQQEETDARNGDPVTDRLDANWRGRLEDVLWALLNSPEFVFTP